MLLQQAKEEYALAMKAAHRELKARLSQGGQPYPAVLTDVLEEKDIGAVQELGILDIPTDRIVGVTTAGRIHAFTDNFRPLLSQESEFAAKWVSLCAAHLGDEGIRDPITCCEYMGKFYVKEGNKRVSVLRHFGAARIPAQVQRILPQPSESPEYQAYLAFLEFFKATGLYEIQFRNPGDYAELLSHLGKSPGEAWNSWERKTFSAGYQYFREAFAALKMDRLELLPEEALLLWLQVYPFRDLGQMSTGELKKALAGLRPDVLALAEAEPVEVRTEPLQAEFKTGILDWFVAPHLNVAFVHPLDPIRSSWILGHDQGREYLEKQLKDRVTVRSYFHADTPELAEQLLEQAVEEGAQVVFTTTPQLSRPTLKVAVKYPKVKFLNCSVDAPYSSIRTYYGRIYEAKFITGAIAGAMANNDRIGYIGTNPIFGVPASINAFALGAQLTNPRARIDLRWSCMAGTPQKDFLQKGIRVISNRDVPTPEQKFLDVCSYGTYYLDDDGNLTPLGSPCWLWGHFYETVVRSILSGAWEKEQTSSRAVNYWFGMDSGVIDVTLTEKLHPGMQALAESLRNQLRQGMLDPFCRKIYAQDGSLKNDGSRGFTPDELLHMDWLCENVDGSIPEYDQVEPFAKPIIRALGIHRDQIPPEMEGSL
ncbi:MAG: BMP family ABC transporter substrate-binding protein [Oscillospiraceae bacterium]|nr:BMP family ABC transporter substrate-binding protein [Oscillospiraceae bacterium]